MLPESPVKMRCQCGAALETWRLNNKVGQLRPPKKALQRTDAPNRSGLPQVIGYRCTSKMCRRRVELSFVEIEDAVIRALRRGEADIRVGVDVRVYHSAKDVRTTTVRAKAPIPGAYTRWWAEADDEVTPAT